ncbi:MAG TPA: hypothetical protein VJM51_03270, partial [Dehalococcoidia bacterium]|nr:hypothetical protein [Dehalococcoidia bacterium]
ERNNGKKEVVVRDIAAFWLITRPTTSNNMNAQGIFIADHIEVGSYTDIPPPGGIYVETARLVPPSY